MKKLSSILLTIVLLAACSDDDSVSTVELIGRWDLIEVLVDPGDGSGTFHPVDSDKTLSFYSDSTVVSNASLCNMFIEPANVAGTGIYSLRDSTITPDCNGTYYTGDLTPLIRFTVEGEYLILNYLCIEACAEKYEMSGQIQVSE